MSFSQEFLTPREGRCLGESIEVISQMLPLTESASYKKGFGHPLKLRVLRALFKIWSHLKSSRSYTESPIPGSWRSDPVAILYKIPECLVSRYNHGSLHRSIAVCSRIESGHAGSIHCCLSDQYTGSVHYRLTIRAALCQDCYGICPALYRGKDTVSLVTGDDYAVPFESDCIVLFIASRMVFQGAAECIN